ncbi:CehA/McbA family metallohydrolase domain-containing protein [Aeoliella mucimassa]|uniref:PHP domain protein n=1 Tax=Aeoliella mucimassa TaxID=2527972 RepID=A0A518AUN2_9BACT|nr:hypothetical protein [Aeoliella mucimassa]QDU58425.1 hypothetical protein Pan181_46600 [Aeoliella mucimassa]
MNRLIALAFFATLIAIPTMTLAHEGVRLSAEEGQTWYRGNMHTHSHWSDGDDYLESIALWYQEHDYQFLVFTDHNVLATVERWVQVGKTKGGQTAYKKLKQNFPEWVEERVDGDKLEVRLRQFPEVAARFNKPGEYLLIQGEEISDRAEGKPIHMNVHNVEELIAPQGGRTVFETIENNVRAVQAQREATGKPMFVHLNHPNFGFAVTAEQLMRVRGERFFEVYNGHPHVANTGDAEHPGTERIWDIILAQRIAALDMPIMFGLAVDDGHNYHNIPSRASEPGRGWVEVLAKELTPEALIESLEAGRFYSSSGVALKLVESSDKQLVVEVEAQPGEEYTIEFVGTRESADLTGKPITDDEGKPKHITYTYSDAIGETLQTSQGNSASYTFAGDELYVRARITSSKPHPNPSEVGDFEQAWTQPVRGPAAPKHEHE